jgi:hypothetical protein
MILKAKNLIGILVYTISFNLLPKCFGLVQYCSYLGASTGGDCNLKPGSAITNGGEPRSCSGQVFNSKLGCIATLGSKCMVCMQPHLKLKTRPKACPVS